MRAAFLQTLLELAAEDERLWLLCGDLGYSVLEPFAERFPGRYLNCGVAEQNMTGVAAGLALNGKIVFTYSIANFPVMRCLEQIRNDVCYHNLSVKIVAVGGGLAYGSAGYSHHAVEDLAVMRVLPNMTVLAPGDPVEARLCTRAAVAHPGPCYLRLGKGGEKPVHQTEPTFTLGRALLVRPGRDLTLLTTGGTLALACQAAEALGERGLTARVLSLPTLQPLDEAAVCAAATETGAVLTIEEHGLGGLASAVAEVLASAGTSARFAAIRLGREPSPLSGGQAALCAAQGLSVEAILCQAERVLEGREGGKDPRT